MLFCKLCGAALLTGAAFVLGLWRRAFLRARVRQAEGYLELLGYVTAQIECFSTPVDRIFANCDRTLLQKCGVSSPPRDFAELLALSPPRQTAAFAAVLTEFAGAFGGCYRAEQLRACAFAAARLTPLCERMRAELPRRERAALLLPPALAAAVLLMLV